MHRYVPSRHKVFALPLRIFFSLLYHQFAWTYDWVAATVSVGMWKQWVLSVLPYLSGPLVLEIGHGPGHLLLAMNQASHNAIGLDRSSQMSHIARHRLASHHIPAKLIRGEAKRIPFMDSSFDHIVTTFPSEYIFDPYTLSESYRVLKPSGTLVILPFAWITGNKPLLKLAAWLFNVTGESPDSTTISLQPLLDSGFLVKSERINQVSSSLLIIQAQKPPN